MMQEAMFDLRQAERTLTVIQATSSDAERILHLVALRAALAHLETFIQPLPH